MTGKHSGHTSVRLNGGGTPLRAEEETIASILKPLGYATGGFGKWGCGGRDSTGVPEKHGFDVFFGYYDQVHAHTFYPPYLIRNSEEVPLAGNRGGSDGQTYSQYVIHEAAMKFIRDHGQGPFFAYLPYTPPHANLDIPDDDPAWAIYKDKLWPEPARRYAAMVTMVDRQVGELLALLKELGIEQNTLIFFSGDNGGQDRFASPEYPRGLHNANKNPQTGVEYRGGKGDLYEGGLRVPFLAYWPGKIAPGRVSDYLGYFPDILPTVAEVTGAKPPADVDGLSLVPELFGEAAAGRKQAEHEYLYWETGSWTAVRQGAWRRPPQAGPAVGTVRCGVRPEQVEEPGRHPAGDSRPTRGTGRESPRTGGRRHLHHDRTPRARPPREIRQAGRAGDAQGEAKGQTQEQVAISRHRGPPPWRGSPEPCGSSHTDLKSHDRKAAKSSNDMSECLDAPGLPLVVIHVSGTRVPICRCNPAGLPRGSSASRYARPHISSQSRGLAPRIVRLPATARPQIPSAFRLLCERRAKGERRAKRPARSGSWIPTR